MRIELPRKYGWISSRGKRYSVLQNIQTGYGAHPASFQSVLAALTLRQKRPKREVTTRAHAEPCQNTSSHTPTHLHNFKMRCLIGTKTLPSICLLHHLQYIYIYTNTHTYTYIRTLDSPFFIMYLFTGLPFVNTIS